VGEVAAGCGFSISLKELTLVNVISTLSPLIIYSVVSSAGNKTS
jgi:hypothetical protein